MLAVEAEDLDALPYPLVASVKMDGIRALITPEGPRTRSMKPIPNAHIAKFLTALPHGLDGEIGIIGENGAVDFRSTTSAVMSRDGKPNFKFFVFDNYLVQGSFHHRWLHCVGVEEFLPLWVEVVAQVSVGNADDVRRMFGKALAGGHEGLILRCPAAPYKFNRSTLKEAGMLKVKPWADAEAAIIGVVEECENTNEAKLDERGFTKRSSAKDGKVGKGRMGTLIVRNLTLWPNEFEIGTGFTAEERLTMWENRATLIGKLAKFKYINVGGYDVPRSCSFLGIRDVEDL